MFHFLCLLSRQGKIRLSKFYSTYTLKERTRILREVTNVVTSRHPRLCNFAEWKDLKIIYKRYASLFFVLGCDREENELIVLETIHHYVEILDRYFGNVCELDLIFNFHKAYHVLDELIVAGELLETSKRSVLRMVDQADSLQENPEESPPDM